jgi:hypothetical protein
LSALSLAVALRTKQEDPLPAHDNSGREKGCVTYCEVNYLIPHDVNYSEVMDDLFATFGHAAH